MRASRTIAAASVLLVALPAAATIWYVDDCTTSGDGTRPLPFCSIQEGVDAAAAGDEVRVLPGTYRECVDTTGSLVILRADSAASPPVIDGSGVCSTSNLPAVVLWGSSEIHGFTIWGGGLSGIEAFGSPVISENVIEGNASDYGGGIYLNSSPVYGEISSEALIQDNTIRNNGASYDGGGIYVAAASTEPVGRHVRIEGNRLTGNEAAGFGGGVSVLMQTLASTAAEVVITGNTIEGNSVTGFAGYYGYGGGVWATTYGNGVESIRIESNTVRSNTAANDGGGISAWIQGVVEGAHEVRLDDNVVSGNACGRQGGGLDLYVHATDIPLVATPRFEASGNVVMGNGAAVAGGGASVWVIADAFSGTQATGALLRFANSLVAANDASNGLGYAAGGGVSVSLQAAGQAVAKADLDFLTVADNGTDVGAGGVDIWTETGWDASLSHEGLAVAEIRDSILSGNLGYGIGKAPPPSGSTDNWQALILYNDVFGNSGGSLESSVPVPDPSDGNFSADPLLDASYIPDACSPTIDRADPSADFSLEPPPNGARANQGDLGATSGAVTSLPDPSGDRIVDGVDILRIATAFASSTGQPRFYPLADLDGNGTVDGADLADVASRFGTDCR